MSNIASHSLSVRDSDFDLPLTAGFRDAPGDEVLWFSLIELTFALFGQMPFWGGSALT